MMGTALDRARAQGIGELFATEARRRGFYAAFARPFSKTISRPQLASLTPGTTSFPNITGGLNAQGNAPAITVGNPYLANYARRHNERVWTIPTSIDLSTYRLLPEPPAEGPFTICWTGSITTLPLFELARPALELLARQRPLRVKIICNVPPKTPIAGADNGWFFAQIADQVAERRQVGTIRGGASS